MTSESTLGLSTTQTRDKPQEPVAKAPLRDMARNIIREEGPLTEASFPSAFAKIQDEITDRDKEKQRIAAIPPQGNDMLAAVKASQDEDAREATATPTTRELNQETTKPAGRRFRLSLPHIPRPHFPSKK
jgi:hypothetical protein